MCTSIYQVAQDGTHLLARTMDWPSLENSPVFLPRQFHWQTRFDHHTYTNRYAIVGGGQFDRLRADVSDGVNEKGLCAQKLTFANGAQLKSQRRTDKTQLAGFEFVLWALGHCASVADVIAQLPDIELMDDTHSDVKYGYPELHFALTDPTGRIVVIEPTTMPMRVIENPLGVVTNSPNFDKQLAQLDQYMDFTPAFRAGQAPLNTAKVTTGSLSGKSIPPGSYSPGARFIRAAYFKERADQPRNEQEAFISSWRLLDGVTVPKNTDHQATYSVYRAATVAESRSYYFQAYHQTAVTKLTLDEQLCQQTHAQRFVARDAPLVFNLNENGALRRP